MSQKRSKIHHYVPQVLQRQFLDKQQPGERIWYAEKKAGSQKFKQPELKKIEKTFQLKDYYTVLDDGQLSDKIERDYYGVIDNYLGKVLPWANDCLARGRVPSFEGKALENLQSVLVAMLKRTPDFIANQPTELAKTDEEIGLEFIEEVLSQEEGELSDSRREELTKHKMNKHKLKHYGRDIRANAIAHPSRMIEEAFSQFQPHWAISETKSSFLLSSQITYCIGNGGHNGMANPLFELWMPVSPKNALVMTRNTRGAIPSKSTITPAHIRSINEYAARTSQKISSHSRNLIESITGKTAKDPDIPNG
jgi:hypothetical protein